MSTRKLNNTWALVWEPLFTTVCHEHNFVNFQAVPWKIFGPRQANLVLIAYASSEGSGEPAHPRSLARTFAARSYKQWVKRNLQTESPSEWLGMRSYNLSWQNARRHKFAWRDSFIRNHLAIHILNWAAAWQSQQNDMSTQQRLRSAWASA